MLPFAFIEEAPAGYSCLHVEEPAESFWVWWDISQAGGESYLGIRGGWALVPNTNTISLGTLLREAATVLELNYPFSLNANNINYQWVCA